ncbi:hypothetical protein L486_05077 [Kwoniella mangroviensis CBS 10435]|uniref:Uncharacterized protein n=1 Tax=Kwoniella mangroviensis CBS 10435 TaxID=1331196 RepID=A0A1B9IQ23_9TREE|nr:hypothetical protein L486_05077 [Kwoniella mangroviensis CBS 10435]
MSNSPTSSSSALKDIGATPPINIRPTTSSNTTAQPTSPGDTSLSPTSSSLGNSFRYNPCEIDKQPWRPDDETHKTRIFSAIGGDMEPSAKGEILSGIYDDLKSSNINTQVTVGDVIAQGKDKTKNYQLPSSPTFEGYRYFTE